MSGSDDKNKRIDASMIMDSMGDIDEDLLREADAFRRGEKPEERADVISGEEKLEGVNGDLNNIKSYDGERRRKKKRPNLIALPIAAAAVLFVVVAVTLGRSTLSLKNSATDSAASYESGNSYMGEVAETAEPSYEDTAASDSSYEDSSYEDSSERYESDNELSFEPSDNTSGTDGLDFSDAVSDSVSDSENAAASEEKDDSGYSELWDEETIAEENLREFALNLPEGYSFGEVTDFNTYRKGVLILPMQYEIEKSSAPDYCRASGSYSEIDPEGGVYVNVSFDDGVPTEDSGILENHTESENIRIYECENLDEGWYCIESYKKHDLYTAAQLAEGVTGDETSDYYVFLYVRDGADTYYELTLSAKCFTAEDAEKIARSIKIN